MKMRDKNVKLPFSAYSNKNRLRGLKKTVKDLETRAKTAYGMRFKSRKQPDQNYLREMQELN